MNPEEEKKQELKHINQFFGCCLGLIFIGVALDALGSPLLGLSLSAIAVLAAGSWHWWLVE